jgi:hypothetical protein
MALKAVVDQETYEALPEAVKSEYKEVNGKFQLDVDGMKPLAEFTVVHNALQKERNDHKKAKDKLALFGEMSPEDVQAQLSRIPELEIAAEGRLDEKKLDELVDKRIHAKIAPIERERDRLKSEVQQKDQAIVAWEVKDKTRTIREEVSRAAAAGKVLPAAAEDAQMLAERIFEVGDDGTVVTKDNVGVTPGLTPELWLKDMQEKRPHWWAPSVGGGANGGKGGGGSGATNPFTKKNWNLTEQGRLFTQDPSKAKRFAEAAGTTVGGPMPSE